MGKTLRENLKNIICLKSMFSKLIASFVLITIIISSFHLATNYIYTQNMKREITKNVSGMFNNIVDEFELYFDGIKDKLLMDFYIEYSKNLRQPKIRDYSNSLMIKRMSKYLLMHKHIKDFVVIVKDFNYIITMNGTLEEKAFFSSMYESEYYTKNFWLDEMKKDFMYKIYPIGKFTAKEIGDNYKHQYLMPIVQKDVNDADFILIVLVDINSFSNELDPEFTKDFYIFNESNELIFPSSNSINNEIVQEIVGKGETIEYRESKDGYIFSKKSPENSLTYYKYYPNTVVKQQINETNKLLTIIVLLSMLISIALSVYIVKKFNNPVKQIYQLIRQSKNVSVADKDIIDLKNIKDSITSIISKNENYIKDINEKNSILKDYFYQNRLKNIFLWVDEPERNVFGNSNYAIILFKIHFRDIYIASIPQETIKENSVLKDLIHVYICELFNDAITFQMEHNQIVSIINIKKGTETIDADVNKIVQKLVTEDDYVYFTIIYSRVYSNSSDLHEAYEKNLEMLRYRKLINKTQIISENTLDRKLNVFYFPEEKQKQFSNLIYNGRKDEAIQEVDNIFDYNLKKEANEFCIYMLYVQVIYCCSNVLLHLYNKIPEELTITNDYYFGEYESIEDYKEGYRYIIAECTDYINENKKQSDYIIDFVKNYINENYTKDISVDLLADELKISRSYLSRYFKDNTGLNLSDYLNMHRIKKACVLLQDSSLMVKDIGPKVGIFSISTFMRLFKNYTGKTPNDYRKSILSNKLK